MRVGEGCPHLRFRSACSRRIWQSPVRRHRLPRPKGAGFVRRIVANGENEIHLGGIGTRELVPRFRPEAADVVVELLEHFDSIRIDPPARLTTGRISLEAILAEFVHHALCNDRSRRVMRAEEQDVEGTFSHVGTLIAAAGGEKTCSSSHGRASQAEATPHRSGRPPQQSTVRNEIRSRITGTLMADLMKRPSRSARMRPARSSSFA